MMERQTRTRPHTLLVVVVILTPSPFAHGGEEAQFNSAFLRMGAHKGPTTLLDTRQFRTGNPLVAGTYPSDIYINEQLVGHG
ncbi:MAG: FimD/PapC N-terminal domain-containing protein, partial [Aeromonadaceae bacterium]